MNALERKKSVMAGRKSNAVKAAEAAAKAAEAAAAENEAVESTAEGIKAEENVAEPKKAGRSTAKKEKEPAKKGAAKTAATTKSTAAKTAVKVKECTIHVQFAGKSYAEEDLMKMAKDVWKYDLKQKIGALESVELYVKPEESKVYYVMNGEFTGNFAI